MTARVAAGTASGAHSPASSGVTCSSTSCTWSPVSEVYWLSAWSSDGREAAHDAQRGRAALHHVADLDLGLGDVRDDEQQRRVAGEPDVDLDVVVAAEDAVLLDGHDLAVDRADDRRARARRRRRGPAWTTRLIAAVAVHEVVLHAAAAGEDVGQLLAEVAAAEAVADRGERHRVGVVDGVEGDGRGHVAGPRGAARRRRPRGRRRRPRRDWAAAAEGRLRGALRARGPASGRGWRTRPRRRGDEGHEDDQRDHTPAPDLVAAAGVLPPTLIGRACVHVVGQATTVPPESQAARRGAGAGAQDRRDALQQSWRLPIQ